MAKLGELPTKLHVYGAVPPDAARLTIVWPIGRLIATAWLAVVVIVSAGKTVTMTG